MRKCTLCGGKVAGNGKCTECGFDNAKNDKKYRLNVHNTKSRMFDHDSCEDNLNQENAVKNAKLEKWQRMLEIGEEPETVQKGRTVERKEKPVSVQRK